ncbi:hypothetical protein EDD17DRAFT_1647969 [Pisolithus thermaeus]|nr:hypothetical protein EDD17DRAFT_1647969 [Pisolithus thermaeus]
MGVGREGGLLSAALVTNLLHFSVTSTSFLVGKQREWGHALRLQHGGQGTKGVTELFRGVPVDNVHGTASGSRKAGRGEFLRRPKHFSPTWTLIGTGRKL